MSRFPQYLTCQYVRLLGIEMGSKYRLDASNVNGCRGGGLVDRHIEVGVGRQDVSDIRRVVVRLKYVRANNSRPPGTMAAVN